MELYKKKCAPCEGGMPPLNNKEIKKLLSEIPEWYLEDGKLKRKYKFKDFKKAIKFVNKVADLAEEEQHHPDILVYSWNKVSLTLYTHAIGGLSENDFILAAKINKLR